MIDPEMKAIIAAERKAFREIERLSDENDRLREKLADLIGHAKWVGTEFGIHYAHTAEAVKVLEGRK